MKERYLHVINEKGGLSGARIEIKRLEVILLAPPCQIISRPFYLCRFTDTAVLGAHSMWRNPAPCCANWRRSGNESYRVFERFPCQSTPAGYYISAIDKCTSQPESSILFSNETCQRKKPIRQTPAERVWPRPSVTVCGSDGFGNHFS
jgi:hypothetical protein